MQETIDNTAFSRIQGQLDELRRSEETESQACLSPRSRILARVFRVPQSFREMSCYSAEPELVSIGPYHRGNPAVLEFENSTKLKLVDSLLRRTKMETGVVLQCLVDAMKKLETRARYFYSEPIDMSHDDFIQMMVTDGCFVVELLLTVGVDEKLIDKSPILKKPGLIPVLTRDLLKFENQLPFFVLSKIFDVCNVYDDETLRRTAWKLFSHSLSWFTGNPKSLDRVADYPYPMDHLLAILCRLAGFVPPRRYTREGYHPLSDQSMQCVTRLRHAGIRFRPRRSADSFLDVQFHKGVLEIPPITINDTTIAALINCVAWEHCDLFSYDSRYFYAYVAFMNCLIKSDRDVRFLCEDGIITSYSHDDHQIAQMFKELGGKVPIDFRRSYLSGLFEEVEAYSGSHWETLRRTYFSSPWSGISVVTAALLLGFTAIQTFMAVWSYVKPPHQ